MLAALDVPMVFNFHAPIRLEINVDARRGKYGVAGCLVDWVGIACSYAEGTILRRADKVLVHSTFMKSLTIKLHRVPDRNILMLPLALDTHKYQPTSNITGVRARLGLPIDRPILLTVRRLEARMGLEVLIQAMQTVVREVPNTLLLIVGSGYLRPRLGQQVQDSGLENHVAFLGQISEDSLPLYYQSADLFVLPTQELEGFGLATIEALSCGTPVVGTPIGATPEILNRVGQGFLSERNDATALADVIIHHLVKGISQQIRQRCREVAIQHYSIEIVMPKLLDALESVCF
jgi:glycosyltransferase involved in cell wall biosynthesis